MSEIIKPTQIEIDEANAHRNRVHQHYQSIGVNSSDLEYNTEFHKWVIDVYQQTGKDVGIHGANSPYKDFFPHLDNFPSDEGLKQESDVRNNTIKALSDDVTHSDELTQDLLDSPFKEFVSADPTPDLYNLDESKRNELRQRLVNQEFTMKPDEWYDVNEQHS